MSIKRIKFMRQEPNLMVSHKIYSNGHKMVRIIIDTEKMTFQLVDPVTGFAFVSGGDGINNLEVLQRHCKRALKEFLGISFEKEKRNVSRS